MKLGMKYWRSSIVAVGILVALVGATVALAANPNPGVLPPQSHPHGKTYGEWNASWWQWFFSVPASTNPGLATNGAVDCSVGQSGHVWFLAGSFQSSGTFTRSCTVPVGTMLFIPLINAWKDNVCASPPETVDQLKNDVANTVSSATNLHASIDGQSLTNLASYRATAPGSFSYTLPPPPDNVIFKVFGVSIPGDCGTTSSTVAPAVADGFYIMLTPLTPGSHRINFGGTIPATDTVPAFTLDVTYNLTVG